MIKRKWTEERQKMPYLSYELNDSMRLEITFNLHAFFSRSAEHSELLIESEARSAKSRSDVAPNARAAQADANLDQGFYI